MAGALWLAQRLARPLIVDWRGLTQLRDASVNYFSEFLTCPPEILGVPVLQAPVADVADYGRDAPGTRWVEPGEARAVGESGSAPDVRYLVLETYHGLDRLHPGPEAERVRLLRAFYRHIQPATPIAEAADRWWEEHAVAPFVVALNVRTGNGQYFGKGMAYAGRVDPTVFENRERFLRVIERACRARTRDLPKPLRNDYVVFHASDSAWMSELLARLPNSVTRREMFPPPGTGDMFCFEAEGEYTDRDSIRDTLADMFLLARCDALVFNSSMFNQYARVTSGQFGGNQAHIEMLFLRKRLRQLKGRIRRRLS
jgi:hypothetical protein